MASWRKARSLDVLLQQVNKKFPGRSIRDDGSIGDARHAAQKSDHNPDANGVVHAIDITHDPAHGFDSYKFADMLLDKRDPRIRYVISNRRIAGDAAYAERNGGTAWKWAPYSGSNPHDHHVHISVNSGNGDDMRVWDIGMMEVPVVDGNAPLVIEKPLLRRGSTGDDVRLVQEMLLVDGIYGPATETAVRQFQKEQGIVADGIVGSYTWRALLEPRVVDPVGWQTGITATVFGGMSELERSAYDEHRIGENELAVSLPARIEGVRPKVKVRNAVGIIVTATIWDVGPWYEDDPYWKTGARPLAERPGPVIRGPNKGRTTNKAGIDLSPATARALGVDGIGKVDWRFETQQET